jgi:hypothetical protein
MTVDSSTRRAQTRTIRDRQAATGKSYADARTDVLRIQEIAGEDGITFAEAAAVFDDPRNQTMCEDCYWTYGMACPECAKGCGCETRCPGWRHKEFAAQPDDPEEYRRDCEECGGSYDSRYGSNGYDCTC